MGTLSQLSSSDLGNKEPKGKKLVGSIHSGMANEVQRNDERVFQEYLNYFKQNKDDIFSNKEKAEIFISELLNVKITSIKIKAKLYFLISACYYSVEETSLSYDYAIKAVNNDSTEQEFNLLLAVLENKLKTNTSSSIALKALINLKGLYFSLLGKTFYENELRNTIDGEVAKFKSVKVSEARNSFFLKSLFWVPVLIFTLLKYVNYVEPSGWFSFNWKPFIFMILLVLGGCYLIVINYFIKQVNHSSEEWEELFINEH